MNTRPVVYVALNGQPFVWIDDDRGSAALITLLAGSRGSAQFTIVQGDEKRLPSAHFRALIGRGAKLSLCVVSIGSVPHELPTRRQDLSADPNELHKIQEFILTSPSKKVFTAKLGAEEQLQLVVTFNFQKRVLRVKLETLSVDDSGLTAGVTYVDEQYSFDGELELAIN